MAELIKEIGVQGNIDVECEAILTQNSVYENEFSEICMDEMKAFYHDSITKERIKRIDLTKEYICGMDPVTAKDLDDALSINDLGNGIYEIGVHIEDVSHFSFLIVKQIMKQYLELLLFIQFIKLYQCYLEFFVKNCVH